MRMHLNNSECSCQLLREAKWQSVHYPLIKGSIRVQHRPHQRKSIFRPRWMHKSEMTEQCAPSKSFFTSWRIWTGWVCVSQSSKDPSNKTFHLVMLDLVTRERNPYSQWLLCFRELSKYSFLCVCELTQRHNATGSAEGHMDTQDPFS